MGLPTFESVRDRAEDKPAFSNGHEWDCWAAANCEQCVHEAGPDRNGACPISTVILFGATPAELTETNPGSLSDRYSCSHFKAR